MIATPLLFCAQKNLNKKLSTCAEQKQQQQNGQKENCSGRQHEQPEDPEPGLDGPVDPQRVRPQVRLQSGFLGSGQEPVLHRRPLPRALPRHARRVGLRRLHRLLAGGHRKGLISD